MIGRLVVLHTILAGLLLAAWWLGGLQVVLGADRLFAIPLIGSLTLIAIVMVTTNVWTSALWLADKLPVIGLAMTVIALLLASTGDLEGIGFKRDILHALVGNLAGVLGFAWVELVAKVCR